MWLGEIFTELGYQAFPALRCRQALAFIQRIQVPVAVLVIDPELHGAQRMVKVASMANPALRLILVRDATASESGASEPGIQSRFTLERPSPGDAISRPEWAAKIRRLLI